MTTVCAFSQIDSGRFHVVMHLYYDRSQEMSKFGKNKKLAH